MIKDRGTLKWTAMMLPEHVQEIRGIWENDKKVPERIVDEQKLELLNQTIQHAFSKGVPVKITYFENGTYIESIGSIIKLDQQSNKLGVLTPQDKKIMIPIALIFDVELTE